MNAKQTRTLLIRSVAITLVSVGIAFSSVSMAAKDFAPIGSGMDVVKPGAKAKPDFDVITIQNGNQSGPMAQWRVGTCKSPHRVNVVVKNWGASYTAGTGQMIKVTLEIFNNNKGGKRIYRLSNLLNSLNQNEAKEVLFNPGIFPNVGSYTLKATISAGRVKEKSLNNNDLALNIFINKKCP